MKIGVPKEIKNNENRVAMTPAGVMNLVGHGHTVFIETAAGLGSGFTLFSVGGSSFTTFAWIVLITLSLLNATVVVVKPITDTHVSNPKIHAVVTKRPINDRSLFHSPRLTTRQNFVNAPFRIGFSINV